MMTEKYLNSARYHIFLAGPIRYKWCAHRIISLGELKILQVTVFSNFSHKKGHFVLVKRYD